MQPCAGQRATLGRANILINDYKSFFGSFELTSVALAKTEEETRRKNAIGGTPLSYRASSAVFFRIYSDDWTYHESEGTLSNLLYLYLKSRAFAHQISPARECQ